MYATIRRYEGVRDAAEAGRRIREDFVPLISQIDGFIAYYFIDGGNGAMVSTSVYENRAGAEASNERAASWIRENPGVVPDSSLITAGEVVATTSA